MQAMGSVKAAIDQCHANSHIMPCLTLLYSTIDVLASLEAVPNEGTRAAFVRWVDTYMLPDPRIPCAGIDIYAARCGIIHGFSADSNLSRSGQAKKISYAWGTADVEKLRRAHQALSQDGISIHVRDLIDAFGAGVVKYIDEVTLDPNNHKPFFHGCAHWLLGIESSLVDELLDAYAQSTI